MSIPGLSRHEDDPTQPPPTAKELLSRVWPWLLLPLGCVVIWYLASA